MHTLPSLTSCTLPSHTELPSLLTLPVPLTLTEVQTLRLSCTAEGDPEPEVMWLINNTEVHDMTAVLPPLSHSPSPLIVPPPCPVTSPSVSDLPFLVAISSLVFSFKSGVTPRDFSFVRCIKGIGRELATFHTSFTYILSKAYTGPSRVPLFYFCIFL